MTFNIWGTTIIVVMMIKLEIANITNSINGSQLAKMKKYIAYVSLL